MFRVKSELERVTDRWKYIGLALGINNDRLKKIERENKDLEDCLTDILDLWLKKVDGYGEPSWELLARAVAHSSGGKNPALAEGIAQKYGGILFSVCSGN